MLLRRLEVNLKITTDPCKRRPRMTVILLKSNSKIDKLLIAPKHIALILRGVNVLEKILHLEGYGYIIAINEHLTTLGRNVLKHFYIFKTLRLNNVFIDLKIYEHYSILFFSTFLYKLNTKFFRFTIIIFIKPIIYFFFIHFPN
jgi:hypothetical protein